MVEVTASFATLANKRLKKSLKQLTMGEVAKIFEKSGPCYVDFLEIFWKFFNILFGYWEILTKRGEIKTQKVEGF